MTLWKNKGKRIGQTVKIESFSCFILAAVIKNFGFWLLLYLHKEWTYSFVQKLDLY